MVKRSRCVQKKDTCNYSTQTLPGSTGRTEPANLTEKLVMEQAIADPNIGKIIPVDMTDPRWHANDGWKKMSWWKEGIEIHYVAQYRDEIIVAIDDFKFKKP